MAAKARRARRKVVRAAVKPRAAKRRATRKARGTRRAARKARIARKPKAPKRALDVRAKKTQRKKLRTAKPKAPKRAAKRVRKPKRVTKKSQTGSRRRVWNGSAMYTKGGLMKKDLMINPRGKLVAKRSSARASGNCSHIKKWVAALKTARKELGITGFLIINRGAQGTALYKRTKELYSM